MENIWNLTPKKRQREQETPIKKEEEIRKSNILSGQIWVEEIKNKILKIANMRLKKKEKKKRFAYRVRDCREFFV